MHIVDQKSIEDHTGSYAFAQIVLGLGGTILGAYKPNYDSDDENFLN